MEWVLMGIMVVAVWTLLGVPVGLVLGRWLRDKGINQWK